MGGLNASASTSLESSFGPAASPTRNSVIAICSANAVAYVIAAIAAIAASIVKSGSGSVECLVISHRTGSDLTASLAKSGSVECLVISHRAGSDLIASLTKPGSGSVECLVISLRAGSDLIASLIAGPASAAGLVAGPDSAITGLVAGLDSAVSPTPEASSVAAISPTPTASSVAAISAFTAASCIVDALADLSTVSTSLANGSYLIGTRSGCSYAATIRANANATADSHYNHSYPGTAALNMERIRYFGQCWSAWHLLKMKLIVTRSFHKIFLELDMSFIDLLNRLTILNY